MSERGPKMHKDGRIRSQGGNYTKTAPAKPRARPGRASQHGPCPVVVNTEHGRAPNAYGTRPCRVTQHGPCPVIWNTKHGRAVLHNTAVLREKLSRGVFLTLLPLLSFIKRREIRQRKGEPDPIVKRDIGTQRTHLEQRKDQKKEKRSKEGRNL